MEENLIMKATGIVRRIDDLGRVVIPKEIRRTLRIREGDPLEIFTDRTGSGASGLYLRPGYSDRGCRRSKEGVSGKSHQPRFGKAD